MIIIFESKYIKVSCTNEHVIWIRSDAKSVRKVINCELYNYVREIIS